MRIFGPKGEKVTREWRKLLNKELNDMYSSPTIAGDKIEKNEIGGEYSAYGGGERRRVYRVDKPEVKITLWRPRRRWEGSIKMDLQEEGCWGKDWIDVSQERYRWRHF
jgi:hypothetical protein